MKGGEGLRLVRLGDEAVVERLGKVPLPPYIHTPLGETERYQTVYARVKGSVAAPTAGLHFTPGLLERVRQAGTQVAFGTLHVGLDTFRPVESEDPRQHRLYSEYGELGEDAAQTINRARQQGGRIIAVGTTSVRLLETAAASAEAGQPVAPFQGWTDLLILPGHRFRAVDALLTNFHLPRSTLLMLVSAFAGWELVRWAYGEAIRLGYRFYSFGDAMLVV